jgi:surface protein
MARPISSDIILVNREGTDYKTTYTDVNPTACDLPLLPGPPVIALNGEIQTAPAEVGDPIDIFREGDGPSPVQNQWQRGLKQDWTDIPGETGTQYTVGNDDAALNIRLQQTFSDGTELYSNEIVGATPPPDPWVGYSVILEVTRTEAGVGTWKTDGFAAIFDKTTKNQIESDDDVTVGRTVIYAAPGGATSFTFKNCPGDFEFGSLTNTSRQTALQNTFDNCAGFTGVGVEYFDTSSVTNMRGTFNSCGVFNGNVSGWDVSEVASMSNLFNGCGDFDGNVSGWNVSKVTNMSNMFRNCVNFNAPIGLWTTSSGLTTISSMFSGCTIFNQDLNSWDVSGVSSLGSTFKDCVAFNGNISGWNIGKVQSLNNAFVGCTDFNQDLNSWETGAVTDMQFAFYDCSNFNGNISDWNVSQVFSMSSMFNGASDFNQDLSGWCVTKIGQEPPSFANGATSWVLPKPIWGSCP